MARYSRPSSRRRAPARRAPARRAAPRAARRGSPRTSANVVRVVIEQRAPAVASPVHPPVLGIVRKF